MSYNVGLNVVEVDGKATPSIQEAETSVAGFIIRSERGIPGQVRQVTNWSRFTEYFGGYVDEYYGAYAVRGFFDNGGTKAYVTRVVNIKAAAPVAAAAVIPSTNQAPWHLKPDGTLTFKIDETDYPVTFKASPASLSGFKDPVDLSNKNISLTVNDVAYGPYTFLAADFANMTQVTTTEVAAVLNREFPRIQVWVDAGDNSLNINTDRQGTSASLVASGTAADDLDLTSAKGEGNVADIEAVTPAEAVAVINEAFVSASTPAPVVVSATADEKVTIVHKVAGEAHSIKIDNTADSSVHAVFGFDPKKAYTGTDGKNTVASVASTKDFLDDAKNPSLTVTAGYRGEKDPGAWGNNVAIRITKNKDDDKTYDLSIRHNGNIVETWEKLNHSDGPDASGRHPKTVINDEFTGSRYIIVSRKDTTNPAPTLNDKGEPAFASLESGADDTFSDDAELQNALAEALNRFDIYEVQLVCCPESDNKTVVSEALTYCENRGDCMFVGHTSEEHNAAAAKAYVKNDNLQGNKVYGALYFPWIQVRNPIGNPKWIPPTGHIMGVYARTERERGIWKAPAGNAARLNGALNVKHHITDAEHTDLVKYGNVNAVRAIPGQGIVIDSSRTLSTNTLWLYVNVRLLFNFVKSSLKNSLRWVVQEPNDETLWNNVKYNSVTPFLKGLRRRGAFGTGEPDEIFTVKIDKENNPPASVQKGIFNVEVYFYPSRPAETIIIKVGQQEGGGTATEA